MIHKLEEYKEKDVRKFCKNYCGLGFSKEESGVCHIYKLTLLNKLDVGDLLYTANNLKEVDAYAAGYLCAKREYDEKHEEDEEESW